MQKLYLIPSVSVVDFRKGLCRDAEFRFGEGLKEAFPAIDGQGRADGITIKSVVSNSWESFYEDAAGNADRIPFVR